MKTKLPFAQVLTTISRMESAANYSDDISIDIIAEEINTRMSVVEACGWDNDEFVAKMNEPEHLRMN